MACKAVDNTFIFFLCNNLNLCSNGCFQSSNGAWIIWIDFVLEEPPQEMWGIQAKQVKRLFHFSFAADKMDSKLLTEAGHGHTTKADPEIWAGSFPEYVKTHLHLPHLHVEDR